jgi:branched-chain amino acid transport system ATP-binding protein
LTVQPILETENFEVRYRGITAVSDANVYVMPGEAVAIFGPNGAGKSTLLLGIMGALATRGEARFNGQRIDNLPTWKMARLGIGYVPEGKRAFPELTVYDNLCTAAKGGRLTKEVEGEIFERFPLLADRRDQLSGSLSGGEQQQLALARALVPKPTCLLVDSLSMGIAPLVIEELYGYLKQVKESGLSILLVEQSIAYAMSVADRAYVMESGRVIVSGSRQEIEAHPMVQRGYL